MLILYRASYNIRYKVAISYTWSFVALARVICGMRYEVEGLENLPNGPAVVMPNHQSFWDNMIVVLLFPRQTWVVKRELFNFPLFGLGLKIADPIAVDRTKIASVNQIIDDGTKKIKQGLWVVIFPEATRVLPGKTVPFKASGAKLAQANMVPIVPMAHNAGLLWPKGFWIKRPGVIKIMIGACIHPKKEEDVRSINAKAEEWINYTKTQLEQL